MSFRFRAVLTFSQKTVSFKFMVRFMACVSEGLSLGFMEGVPLKDLSRIGVSLKDYALCVQGRLDLEGLHPLGSEQV